MLKTITNLILSNLLATFIFFYFIQCVVTLHRQFTQTELIQTFGVNKLEYVPEYNLINTFREHHSDGTVQKISFEAWNDTYIIELQKNKKLISPYLKTIIRKGNKTTKLNGLPTKNSKKNCHFFGKVISHGKIKAAISDCQKLMGVIVHENYFLIIQTLPHRFYFKEPKRHLVYKRSAALINPIENFVKKFDKVKKRKRRKANFEFYLNSSETNFLDTKYYKKFDNLSKKWLYDSQTENSVEEFCEINNTSIYNYTLSSEAKLDSLFIFPQLDPITLEIGLFLDSKLYEHFKREFLDDPVQHLTDFSLALINNVHILYQQPTLSPNIEIVIVHFELWKTQPPILATELHKNGQAQTLLDSFCRYQARINPGTDLTDPGHWDHAVLLTGYDIYHTTSSVAGVAPVGRMCDDIFACSLVEGLHLGRSFVLAHEMGHNMGMVHDGVQNQCGRSCCLMSAVNGAGKTTWSTCSVREFNAFLLHLDENGRGNCLRENTENIYSHNHFKDTRLPGQRFTADQQCSYFWGRDYQVEIPNGRSYEDICRILWCGNSGSTISTAHPALEGSWCGGEKWCHEGRCEPWSYTHLPPPKIVHGEWSKWSNTDTKCPISPCQIAGSIALKSELRTCTNPAPNNGGLPCKGMNVRGIICGSKETFCEGYSRQEFGDHLCTSILNDATRPDFQLSGTSFLHATQPCKVWCHVQNSEMIRNKGQFPNGSPCGVNKYCVSGSCLNLSCENKAVVANDSDCPNLDLHKKNLVEEPWSEWSACSTSCGNHGVQNRYRNCKKFENCEEKNKEIRLCNSTLPKCFQYSLWSKWSKCDATCGSTVGKKKRKRFCIVGDCPSKSLFEEKSCENLKPCKIAEWREWDEWSTCSVTCGSGQTTRKRECILQKKTNTSENEIDKNIFNEDVNLECKGESTAIKPCNLELCSKEKEKEENDKKEKNLVLTTDQTFVSLITESQEKWSEWTPCSVTCGIGFQLRERKCANNKMCLEKKKQARTCNVQNCSSVSYNPIFSEWSLWSACSQTCGQGYQYRHRKCVNSLCSIDDVLSEHRRCVLGPCPNWGDWEIWLKECTSCNFFEIRRRERKCLVMAYVDGVEQKKQVLQNNCLGEAYELENCKNACFNRQKIFKDENNHLFASPIFSQNFSSNIKELNKLTMYFSWQEWNSCSVSCGKGVRQRKRVCMESKNCFSNDSNIEFEICVNQPCSLLNQNTYNYNYYWNDWTEWSHCSKNCNKYFKVRTRTCRVPLLFLCNGSTKEEKLCDEKPCENSEVKVPEWSEWSNFSACSCFTLTKFRRRYCKIFDPTVQGFCAGSVIDQKPCKPVSCVSTNGGWSNWSDWSACSRECGLNGHQIRNRMCSNPLPSNQGLQCFGHSFDQRRCNKVATLCTEKPVDGEWSKWTEWSSCSECINGQRSRTRYCSNPRPLNGGLQCIGSDFDLEACNNIELCYATPQYELDSKHENISQQSLNNTNNLKNNLNTFKSIDGGFSLWTEWSNCSAQCGFSFQSRQRYCNAPLFKNGGRPCTGLSYMTSICTTKPCHNFVDGQWSNWSEWSETNCLSMCANNTGIRIRERTCNAPAPLIGGLLCFGPRTESTSCLNSTFNLNISDTNDATCLSIKNLRLLETQTSDLNLINFF